MYWLVAAPAAVGAALGALAYFGEDTGVDGTAGALIALVGAVAVFAGALLALSGPQSRGWRTTLDVLLALGSVLTAFAAWMLMQYAFAAAMALSAVGLAIAILGTSRRRST